MTVINAMKFSDNEGGMVTDSQSSTRLRKYDFAEKIVSLEDSKGTVALIGGAGLADILHEACVRLQSGFDGEGYNIPEVAKGLAEVMTAIKRERIGRYLQSTFGIDSEQALSGACIGDHLRRPIAEAYAAQSDELKESFCNGFIIIGKDQNGVNLYSIGMGGEPYLSARPYASLGSGDDESDKVLYGFVRGLKREQRRNIPLVDGMTALIRATHASSELNKGVGGIPTIAYFDPKGIIMLGEDESLFATEIVTVADAGLILPETARESLNSLLRGNTEFKELERAIFRDSNNYDEIMRFLRGYK